MRKFVKGVIQALKKGLLTVSGNIVPPALKRLFLKLRTNLYYQMSTVPLPATVVIDPSNICNLSCPLCPTGLKRLNYERSFMSLENFKTIVGHIEGVKNICLYNWGEPFLNPQTIEMIKHAADLHFSVIVHSNFSVKADEAFFDSLARSGLDELILSIDGASPESYSKYKKGGDFELVISNIKKLVAARSSIKSGKPRIIWKFIVNRYNEGEIEKARETAGSLGIDFRLQNMGLSDDLPDFSLDSSVDERKKEWLPSNDKYVNECYAGPYAFPLSPHKCDQLVSLLVVNPDGRVFPCCWVTDKSSVFGDLLKDKLADVWNNAKYAYSRNLFVRKKYNGPEESSVCSVCRNFKKMK